MRPEKKRRGERRKQVKNFRPNPAAAGLIGLTESRLAIFAAEVAMTSVLREVHATPSEILLLSAMVKPALGVLRAGGSIDLPVPANDSDPAQAASPEGKQ